MRPGSSSVSVIVPVYNGEAFLAEAIASVQCQRHDPLEIIIVDDGSTDRTRQVVSSLAGEIRYEYQTNSGAPAARNTGLKLARGKFISFLDADDLWTENKLAIQLMYLANDPTVDVVLGHTQFFRVLELERGERRLVAHSDSQPALSLGGATFRRSAFERVGFLDETLPLDDDVDWFLRAKEHGLSIRIHHDVVQLYRRHQRNMTNQRDMNYRYFLAALRKSLHRRRESGKGAIHPLGGWFE